MRVARYASISELLRHETPTLIAPDLTPEQLLQVARAIYPPDKEALGLVALEIRPVDTPAALDPALHSDGYENGQP